jgi:hypothetical protein
MNMDIYISRTEQEILSGETYTKGLTTEKWSLSVIRTFMPRLQCIITSSKFTRYFSLYVPTYNEYSSGSSVILKKTIDS